MTVTYSYAPEAEEIGKRLIAEHHRDLLDFGQVEVRYVFRSEAAKSAGRTTWGKARKLSGLNALLAMQDDAPEGEPPDDPGDEFFVIELAYDVWRGLNRRERAALVDHELCHCNAVMGDNGPELKIVGHDVEEFEAILRRHSFWRPDLESFAIVVNEQLSLLNVTVPDDLSGMGNDLE